MMEMYEDREFRLTVYIVLCLLWILIRTMDEQVITT